MKVQHVEQMYVHQVWPLVEPLIRRGFERREGSGEYSFEEMKTLVTMGHWMMIVVLDDIGSIIGVVLVNYINRPSSRVAFVTFASGKRIANNAAFSLFVSVVKSFGATEIEAAVVGSRERLWQRIGLVKKYSVVGTKL